MRALAALSAVVFSFAARGAVFAQETPYTVTAADRAPLRAAASETNEPTAYLAAGTTLEVYRQEGNFLAVRPPEGSFSWVRASDVQPTADADIVQVVASGAQAWVGHQGSDLRAISQVTLQAGEKLRVLAAVAGSSDPAQAAWYKIAPPAGEFRFLLAQHVAATAAAPAVAADTVQQASWTTPSLSRAEATSSEPLVQAGRLYQQNTLPAAAADPVAERLQQIDAQLAAMLAQPPSTWNTTALYGELQTLTASAPTAELRTQAQDLWWRVAKCQQVQQGYVQIAAPRAAPLPTFTQPNVLPAVAQASFVAPLNAAATQPLVQPQPQGELQPLVTRLKEIATSVSANVQQQQAYRSPLRNRRAASPELAAAGDEPARSVLAAAAETPAAADPEAEAGGYAGTGWLMPLVNRSQLPRDARSGVPPFALTDDAGNVKFLVTPTPGLSVSEYARKKVGIIGPVGQLPNLTNPHLTAQRVVVLDRHE